MVKRKKDMTKLYTMTASGPMTIHKTSLEGERKCGGCNRWTLDFYSLFQAQPEDALCARCFLDFLFEEFGH